MTLSLTKEKLNKFQEQCKSLLLKNKNHLNGINKTDWPLIIYNLNSDSSMPTVSVSSTTADLKNE